MDVTMPQLGETVTEGTITRWFKQVGEHIDADEPLFEVSTDKVDSEVPAPSAGVVSEILVPEGETVEVGARLAVISDGDAPPPRPHPRPSRRRAPRRRPSPNRPARQRRPPEESREAPAAPAAPPSGESDHERLPKRRNNRAPAPEPARPAPATAGIVTSPLVRRLITEHGLDPATIRGTGEGGRITRNDVLAAARDGQPAPAAPAPHPRRHRTRAGSRADRAARPLPHPRASRPEWATRSSRSTTSAAAPPSTWCARRRPARTCTRRCASTSNASNACRRDAQAEWKASEGFSLTYLPFIVRAFSDVVHDYPHVNASVDGETLVVHRDIHLGIAIDLDFKGLSRRSSRTPTASGCGSSLARSATSRRARRASSSGPDELVGGTFTITNMGPFGTTLTLPIINQPQVAILATDGIRKEPVVIEGPDGEDTIAVHHVGHLALAWDHRAFDGAYAASFLNEMRTVLETRDWEAELA